MDEFRLVEVIVVAQKILEEWLDFSNPIFFCSRQYFPEKDRADPEKYNQRADFEDEFGGFRAGGEYEGVFYCA